MNFSLGNRLIRFDRANNYVSDWAINNTPGQHQALRVQEYFERLERRQFNENYPNDFFHRIAHYVLERVAPENQAPIILFFSTIFGLNVDQLRAQMRAYGRIDQPYESFQNDFTRDAAINIVITKEIRNLLNGSQTLAQPDAVMFQALPALIVTLVVAEVNRNRLSWLTTLILMDFIEARVPYGQAGNKFYTWFNLLWDTEQAVNYNAFGYPKDAHEWGGKHPMAHTGSFSEQKSDPWQLRWPLTSSRQKEGSLLIRWLARQLQRNPQITDIQTISLKPQDRNIPNHQNFLDSSQLMQNTILTKELHETTRSSNAEKLYRNLIHNPGHLKPKELHKAQGIKALQDKGEIRKSF